MSVSTSSKTSVFWLGFFSLTFLAWMGLFVLSLEHPLAPVLGAMSSDFDTAFWRAICSSSPSTQPIGELVLMWGLMAGAMMAPTAVPAVAAYRDVISSQSDAALQASAFVGGFLTAWLGFAVVAALLNSLAANLALLSPHGISLSNGLSVALLLLAGLYQFSSLKAACLKACQSPVASLMSRWRGGVSGAFEMGLRNGLTCVGCCWILMLLAFVGGTMNLIWMGGAMALMILEKLPDIGGWVTKPLGYLLIAAAVYMSGSWL